AAAHRRRDRPVSRGLPVRCCILRVMRTPQLAVASFLIAACATAPPAPPPPAAPAPAPAAAPAPADPAPPVAPKNPAVTTVNGHQRVDDYAWMKKKGAPEIEDYLRAENRYSDWWMERTKGLQETLYKEMLGHIQETDSTAPYPMRGYEYYSRTE